MKCPLIVIHGGPGMSHHYLKKPLKKIFKSRDLIFYDQYIEPDTKVCREEYRKQLSQLIEKHPSCGIIAHSFGAAILFDLLDHQNISPLEEVLLISPLPQTASDWQRCLEKLFAKIPKNEQERMGLLEGKELGELLFPYYLDNPSDITKLEVDVCNLKVNAKIMNEFTDWNFKESIKKLPKHSLCIYGESDISFAEMNQYNLPHEMIKNANHFSFIEQEESFTKAVRSYL